MKVIPHLSKSHLVCESSFIKWIIGDAFEVGLEVVTDSIETDELITQEILYSVYL